jgi:2-polyprenyl-3-methyl-5-hydroxy-6-metoxy-1,4-benzoquinol methylase
MFFSIEDIVDFAPFDVVFLLDTIEHIYDIPHFLSYIKEILKSKGFVVLLTGNNNSIPAKIFKNNWWYLRFSEHIVFPSIKYLSQLNDFILQEHQNTYAFKSNEKINF